MFCKKSFPRNFAKFTGKQLRQSLFFNKVADLKPVTLLQKRLWHRSFPVNFAKFLTTPFLVEHFRWLLLGPFLGCQSMWYFSRNTIFSRMNIIFFGDAGDPPLGVFFRSKGIFVFLPGGQCRVCNAYAYIQKISCFRAFFDKDHLLSFSAKRKNIIFSGKKKYHLSRYYKKDHVQARIFWKDHLFRTFDENIIFSGIFFEKDHLSFCV